MLFNARLRRVSEEMKTKLQLSPDFKTRDWFLYNDHIVIKVYGFTKAPYLFPVVLTPSIFALEFIRQSLQFEAKHFWNLKKKTSNFKFNANIGPFIVKSRSTLPVVERFLKDMNFREAKILRYDPHHIISQRRLQNNNVPFEHQEVEGLEKLANLENLGD